MTKYREILRLHSQGISQRSIAISCECSRNTISRVLERAMELEVKWPLTKEMTDGELDKLFFPQEKTIAGRRHPDLESIHKELAKSGVTLKLLWSEYCEECRLHKELPLMYSHFCYHYQKFAEKKRATMHIPRKPGEQTEVDWAGQTASIVDRDTGEIIPAFIFVAVLSYSQYAYVEAFLSQDQESWISAHVNMYIFFGGVTRILVPDNLKTGVQKSDWYSPVINKSYHEMAEYYNTAVIPARVRKPKDKPGVEGTVGNISTWIVAALRNQKFFSLQELNRAVWGKLSDFNSKHFQKKEGNRQSVFLCEEKPLLMPLPPAPYELAVWKTATVQYNYHISVDKMHYSVPNEYIKHKVDVRVTRNVIEVFYNQNRICSHLRLYGRPGQYSTIEAHMPENHQRYVQWDAERYVSWAEKIGPSATVTVKAILSAHKVEQQAYRSCMALLKLADKYSISRLEAACMKALSYTPHPSYKSVKTILSTGHDKIPDEKPITTDPMPINFGFTRGAGYYGRDKV